MPSLDGWRAVAVLGVMMTHDQVITLFGHSNVAWKGYGGHGVELFFAISGFLITTRILEEETLVGRFDIQRFYIRRIFRIQPAALVYLFALAALVLSGVVAADWSYWWGGLLLYQNYLYHPPGHPSLLGHFWTLAVEEHFYIVLSLTLLVIKRGRIVVLAVMFLVSMLFTIGVVNQHLRLNSDATPRATQWQIHFLLWASLLAVVVRRHDVGRWVRRWLTPWLAFSVTLVVAVLHNLAVVWHRQRQLSLIGDAGSQWLYVMTWFVAFWVIATVFHPRSLTTRILELRPLRFLGRISYSLYLWHALFFYGSELSTGRTPWLEFLGRPPLRYLATFGVAVLSYYIVERPLVRLGHSLAPPATPGHRDLADLPVETPLVQPPLAPAG